MSRTFTTAMADARIVSIRATEDGQQLVRCEGEGWTLEFLAHAEEEMQEGDSVIVQAHYSYR